LAAEGRGANRNTIDFLTTQLWLLMFADDIVLIGTSYARLSTLFGYTDDFCAANDLSIN
jgi:hypothetical protein